MADRDKYQAGKTIVFPLAGNRYRITKVDGDRVTFAPAWDPEDEGTETIADLDAADVEVI